MQRQLNYCATRYYGYLMIAILCAVFMTTSGCNAGQVEQGKLIPLPEGLVGSWLVTEVHVDQGPSFWSLKRDHEYNIYKYLGRQINFQMHKLVTNLPDEKLCEDLMLRHYTMSLDEVIATSLFSRTIDPPPTSADFGLSGASNAVADVYGLQCNTGVFMKGLGGSDESGGIKGAWLIKLADKRLGLRWGDETILILVPLLKDARPVASYDCAKAATKVEITICNSVALAAYDKSVAETYKFALNYFKNKKSDDDLSQLKSEQKLWITKRNACDSDISCLEKSMSDRIDDIDYQMAEYGYAHRNE